MEKFISLKNSMKYENVEIKGEFFSWFELRLNENNEIHLAVCLMCVIKNLNINILLGFLNIFKKCFYF